MPKLLKKSNNPKSTDVDDDMDEGTTTETDGSENATDSQPAPKTDNNQTILRILGDGEKVRADYLILSFLQ